jgi:hypothetical protein
MTADMAYFKMIMIIIIIIGNKKQAFFCLGWATNLYLGQEVKAPLAGVFLQSRDRGPMAGFIGGHR